jgi:phosphohistidine phosphatase SixA
MQHAEADNDDGGITEEDRRLLEIIEREIEGE